MANQRTVTLLALVLAIAMLLFVSFPGNGTGPDSAQPDSLAATSSLLRLAARTQTRLLAEELPAPEGAAKVRNYFRYSNLLYDPDRRSAAQDSFFARWATEPGQPLLIEIAYIHRRRIGHASLRKALLAAAAGEDTTTAIYQFAVGRRDWRKQPGADFHLTRAADLAQGRDPLLAVWSRIRLAGAIAAKGQAQAAIQELAALIRPAWFAGGPILASALWIDISRISRQAGRLDDAVLAADMAEACARACGSGYQATRALLSAGRAQLQRGRPATASEIFTTCYQTAVDSGFVRLRASAMALSARAANAAGDLSQESADLEHLLEISRASADTNSMLLAAIALASGQRRAGDLKGARAWFTWADTLNSDWASGDHTASLMREQATLWAQVGNYDAADSLNRIAAQETRTPLDPAEAVLLQINLILQGLETDNPDLSYRALAHAKALHPESLPRSGSFNPAFELALAAAQLYARQGEFLLADAQLEDAAKQANTLPPHATWFMLDTRGKVSREEGDYEAARRSFDRSLALADTLAEPDLIRRSRVRLSAVLLAEGDFAAAESLVSASCSAPEYWTRLSARLIRGMALAGAGHHRAALAAFAATDTALGTDPPTGLAARLTLEKGRSLAALGQFQPAREILESTMRALPEVTVAATSELERTFNRDIRREIAEALLGLHHDNPRLAAEEATATATRLIAAWGRHQNPAPIRGPILEFFVGPRRSFVWTSAGPGGVLHWREMKSTEALSKALDDVLVDLAYPGRAVDTSAVAQLARLLFGSEGGFWPAGSTLAIVPEEFLATVPWSALPWPATGETVLEHGPLVISTGSPVTGSRHSQNGLLVIGANGTAGLGMQQLAEAEAEAHDVAALWTIGPVELRTGMDGSLADLLPDGLRGFRAIHLASHAQIYQGNQGHASIHIVGEQGQPLTISRINSTHLDADLVYLSNCEGARRHLSMGHGVQSFADAFLAAGADGVIATSIRVDDAAGRALAKAFYGHWLTGMSRAAALRSALLEVKNSEARWQHPFYWGFTNFYTRPKS